MSMGLVSHCYHCFSTKNLTLCTSCKVTPYCSQEHSDAFRPYHARVCNDVQDARVKLADAEDKLREAPATYFFPGRPFEDLVGRFWGITETRPYMLARFGLVEVLTKLHTFDGVKESALHVRDMLRLNQSDNLGVRNLYPVLLLRLGQDQEAYDFMKWYLTVDFLTYDWGNLTLPYLNIANADVYEPIEFEVSLGLPDLGILVCMALLKLKLLLDVKKVSNTRVLEEYKPTLPPEIHHDIRGFVAMSDLTRKNIEILSLTNIESLKEKLSNQFLELFRGVKRANKHFWPVLAKWEDYLEIDLDESAMGSIEEAQVALHGCFHAWNEIPGAIDMVQHLAKGKPKMLRTNLEKALDMGLALYEEDTEDWWF